MTLLGEVLLRLPAVVILCYLPFLCYLDIKDREIPHLVWAPLWATCLPITAYLYLTGNYSWGSLIFSLIMCGVFWAMHRKDLIQGADLMLLLTIALFFQLNPFPVPHGPEQPVFFVYLVGMMILTAPVLFFLNLAKGRIGSLKEMMTEWPRGIPMVLPISAALVLTVVMG
jgi:multisubunit Na+/H+ antiporter MnhC subunit